MNYVPWYLSGESESCDISDTSQLGGIDSNFNITEELGSLTPITGTAINKNLYNEVKPMLENLIPLKKLLTYNRWSTRNGKHGWRSHGNVI